MAVRGCGLSVFLSSWRVTALKNKWDHFVNYDLENLEKGEPQSRKKVEGGSGPLREYDCAAMRPGIR